MDIEDFADITLGVISLFFIILFGFLIFVWLPTALINQAK